MNSSERNHDRLLAELFHGEWDSGAIARAARLAAGRTRRYRRRRRITTATGGIVAACAIMWFAWRSSDRDTGYIPPQSPKPQVVHAAPTPQPSLEIISDNELLALLHDRSLLVIRDNDQGHITEIVFLDSLAAENRMEQKAESFR